MTDRIGLMLDLEESRYIYKKIYNRDVDDRMVRKLIARLSDIILDLETRDAKE